jgi:hypothetical protein
MSGFQSELKILVAAGFETSRLLPHLVNPDKEGENPELSMHPLLPLLYSCTPPSCICSCLMGPEARCEERGKDWKGGALDDRRDEEYYRGIWV